MNTNLLSNMFCDQKSGYTWLKLDIDTTSFLTGGSMKRSAFKFIQVWEEFSVAIVRLRFFVFLQTIIWELSLPPKGLCLVLVNGPNVMGDEFSCLESH